MKRSKAILWGIVLVIIGVLLGLDSLGILSFDIFFDGWWTLILIVPCFIGIFTDQDKMGNVIGLIIGVFLLFCSQNILSFDLILKLLFPIIIVLVGSKMIFGSVKSKKSANVMNDVVQSGGTMNQTVATFSGQDVIFNGEEFTGAELNAVFGGIKYDLRNAVIQKDCVIKATAIFGGIDIFIPDNVNVKINSTSIFGGVSDKAHKNSASNTVTIYLEGLCLFGGVDIK